MDRSFKGLRHYIDILKEDDINIDVRGIQQAAKVKAYQDAKLAGKTEEEAQNAEAAAGNLAGADALAQQGQAAGLTTAAAIPVAAPAVAAPAVAAPAVAAPKQWGAGVLGLGSKGPEVKELQKRLGIPDDGSYGPATQKAVIELQKKLKVNPDGAYGPLTKAAHDRTNPTQGSMSANVADQGQPAATGSNAALGTVQGATKAIPTVAAPAGNPSGVGKNATYTADEIAAAQEALKDKTLGASDRAFYTGMLANQPKATVPAAPAPVVQQVAQPAAPAPVVQQGAQPAKGNVGPRPVNIAQARQWAAKYAQTHDPATGNPLQESTGYNELDRIVSLVHYR